MSFKYKENLENLNATDAPCPASDAFEIEANMSAFRIIKSDSPSPADFIPPGILNKSRFKTGGRSATCSHFALSFFETKEQSIAQFARLKRTMGSKVLSAIGDGIAETTLFPVHGIATPPNVNGHFDLYEYEDAKLEMHSQFIQKASND